MRVRVTEWVWVCITKKKKKCLENCLNTSSEYPFRFKKICYRIQSFFFDIHFDTKYSKRNNIFLSLEHFASIYNLSPSLTLNIIISKHYYINKNDYLHIFIQVENYDDFIFALVHLIVLSNLSDSFQSKILQIHFFFVSFSFFVCFFCVFVR